MINLTPTPTIVHLFVFFLSLMVLQMIAVCATRGYYVKKIDRSKDEAAVKLLKKFEEGKEVGKKEGRTEGFMDGYAAGMNHHTSWEEQAKV